MSDIRYLLYISPESKPCKTALIYTAATKTMIGEIDVSKLSNKPMWLVGTPTLLDREKTLLYKGTNCLKKLQALCANSPIRTGKTTPPLSTIQVTSTSSSSSPPTPLLSLVTSASSPPPTPLLSLVTSTSSFPLPTIPVAPVTSISTSSPLTPLSPLSLATSPLLPPLSPVSPLSLSLSPEVVIQL